MHVIRDPLHAGELPRGAVVTIGNFDGVHLGHRRILDAVVSRARVAGRPSVAITFDPHPLAVLRPDVAPPRIQTLRQKEESIARTGIEFLLILPFTRDFSLTEPEAFATELLGRRLEATELVLGSHFAFGRGKRGNLELLRSLGPTLGFSAAGVEEAFFDGEPISSTRIRQAVGRGDFTRANAMLGRDYEIDGIVARGKGRGRQLGFPTINLAPENELFPGNGVYVTRTAIASRPGALHSVTNVGRRPTLYEDTATSIETHILDFSGDVYGDQVRVFFLERLRDEKKFDGPSELAGQILRDVADARASFARRGPTPR